MKVAVACDHAGFVLKFRVIEELRTEGHEFIDLGTNPVDYPDYSRPVAQAILSGAAERAVLICGSGAGACVAVNKFCGIRAATCHDTFSARQSVEDDDVNVLCLGGRVIGFELAVELVRTYLRAHFSGAERHVRRLSKVPRLKLISVNRPELVLAQLTEMEMADVSLISSKVSPLPSNVSLHKCTHKYP